MNRTVTIIRKKAFAGSACRFSVEINGKRMIMIGNGQTITLNLPEGRCVMRLINDAFLGSHPDAVEIQAYERNATFVLEPVLKRCIVKWALTRQSRGQDPATGSRKESIELISGMVCMLTVDHILPKMRQFRQQGWKLYVNLHVGEAGVQMAPDQARTGCTVGEPVDCSYVELTADPGEVSIHRLNTSEQRFLTNEMADSLGNLPETQVLKVERYGNSIALSLK